MRLSAGDPADVAADVLVIGVARDAKGAVTLAGGAATVDAAFDGRLAATLADLGATGKKDETTRLASLGRVRATTVLAVGLGDAPSATGYDLERLRRAAGVATRVLDRGGTLATTLAGAGGQTTPDTVAAIAEGLLLGAYRFTRYRAARNGAGPVRTATVLTPAAPDRVMKAAVRRAEVLVAAVSLTRDLVNTAPGDLHPSELADAARRVATTSGLDVEVLDERALKRGKYGGILGVGAGSTNPPRLIRLAYRHPHAKRTVALVGKGITFDSGGLSIKPAVAMEWMKSDMGGAAAVIATLQAVAALKPKVNVIGYAPAAENMPSGTAIRPSDVLTMHGGTTVEVLNTDAEGRLILADAIVRAGADAPDLLIDVATLTGAQLVALGSHVGAVMANDDDLRTAIIDAAGRAGELMWPMPLPDELRPSLDSTVADLSNTGDRYGGMLVAGLFLREFVPAGVRWAHLDVAGPAFNQGAPYGYTPKGGTGVPVRTLVRLIEDVAEGRLTQEIA